MAKLSIFFIAFFVISTVDLCGKQVMGTRDIELDVAIMEAKLLPVRGLGTCLRPCNTNSDCSDCWVCCTCRGQCSSQALVTGGGYLGAILKNQNQRRITDVAYNQMN